MDIIIYKLNIPDDIKYIINQFCYDSLGYTFTEKKKIKEQKRININNIRLKVELWSWKKMDVSVSWLKPLRYLNSRNRLSTNYWEKRFGRDFYFGVYNSFEDEINAFQDAYQEKIINYLEFMKVFSYHKNLSRHNKVYPFKL